MFWDPSPVIFRIPYIHHPVTWYGALFALGVWLGYQFFFKNAGRDKQFCESLSFYIIIGTLFGARLGHVIFYEPIHDLTRDPFMVLRIWEGGLASHGGVVGIMIALWIFCHKKQVFFARMIDDLAIPACIAAVCIRLGNFVNQEILGTITNIPWAVTFGHPADLSAPIPRHPVQLYEALFYLTLAFLLPKVEKKGAWMLVSLFTFRFLIEWLKEPQSYYTGLDSWLTMGQWLSLPLILFGLVLIGKSNRASMADKYSADI